MVVDFEFFSNEPIENVITCMHFKVDKVVYFGYYDMVQNRSECTENFLKIIVVCKLLFFTNSIKIIYSLF